MGKLAQNNFRSYVKNSNATTGTQDLLANYYTLLARNVLNFLFNENAKVAVEHILSVIQLLTLHDRLTADLSFAKYELPKNLHDFLKHAIHLAEAFHDMNTGPSP